MKLKPRNHIVLAMIKSSKSFGVHKRSTKAQRQQEKTILKKNLTKEIH